MSEKTYHASLDDGKQILEILEKSPSKGNIELLYTRRPDAYESYKKESRETNVFIVKQNEKAIGTVAEIVRNVYIGGEIKKLSYICGLKKDCNYKGNINWGRILIKDFIKKDTDIDCYFCSIIKENEEVQKMFEKKRKSTLNIEKLQEYRTYMLAPYFKLQVKQNDYIFRKAEKDDESSVLNFLNSEGRKKDFFPVIENIEQFHNLNIDDFYILENRNHEILVTAALWNQTDYRQYIVKHYKGFMKIAKLMNPLLKLLGYMKLPKENETINFPMLAFFISKDDNEEYYKVFLNHIVKEIKKEYDMFVIGVPENNFSNNIYEKLRNIHFDTIIYSVRFMQGNDKFLNIDKNKLWIECGLL